LGGGFLSHSLKAGAIREIGNYGIKFYSFFKNILQFHYKTYLPQPSGWGLKSLSRISNRVL
jgi:hypothetical protein